MKQTNDIMKTWAIPLGFQIFGQEIGDHTWVAGDAGYCEGCCFGTHTKPDPIYCDQSLWKEGKYTPPATSRELHNGPASAAAAACIAGDPYNFMGIPSQCGIVYAINGVCHNLANRTLYPSGVTVEGALGYWFTQAIYGTYGTMVPMPLILPLVPVPFFPFVVPNPLFPAALAWTAVVDIQWLTILTNCGVSALTKAQTAGDEWTDYLRRVQELYVQPIVPAQKNEWTAEELFAVQVKMYERHMQEVDMTLAFRRHGVSPDKMSALHGLWADFHRPSRENIDSFFKGRSVVNLRQLPKVNLNEQDATLLANSMNTAAGEQLKKVIALLGPDDFKTIYGHAPEQAFLVINPMILKEG